MIFEKTIVYNVMVLLFYYILVKTESEIIEQIIVMLKYAGSQHF